MARYRLQECEEDNEKLAAEVKKMQASCEVHGDRLRNGMPYRRIFALSDRLRSVPR